MTKAQVKGANSFTARYEVYEYALHLETNYYQKTKGNARLPDELQLDPVRVEDKYRHFGVSEILTSRQVSRVTAFKTGLQKCSASRNFYSGDIDEGNNKKSLVAMAFSVNKQLLRVFVFWGFWKEHTQPRMKYVEDFLTNQFRNQ
ncbi:MAG: hypothetical protein U0X91_07200 [Spirosomataceae bacterium]